jgi:nicotinamidase-related amidase
MPATVIAERIDWAYSVRTLSERVRELRSMVAEAPLRVRRRSYRKLVELRSARCERMGGLEPRWSAFHRTPLHQHLADLGVDTIVVAGCNFPNCPRATIYDGSEHDYRVLVPVDAVSAIEAWHIGELAMIVS